MTLLLGKYEVRATWTINQSSSTQMHLFLQSCQSGSFCLTSSWADRETYERSRKWNGKWKNGLSLLKKRYGADVTWHDFSDGVMFLSSSQYMDETLKSHFQQWAKTLRFLFFFLAKTINSHLKILFPRDLYCWSVETTFWGFFLDTSLGLVLASDISFLAPLSVRSPLSIFSP